MCAVQWASTAVSAPIQVENQTRCRRRPSHRPSASSRRCISAESARRESPSNTASASPFVRSGRPSRSPPGTSQAAAPWPSASCRRVGDDGARRRQLAVRIVERDGTLIERRPVERDHPRDFESPVRRAAAADEGRRHRQDDECRARGERFKGGATKSKHRRTFSNRRRMKRVEPATRVARRLASTAKSDRSDQTGGQDHRRRFGNARYGNC